MPSMEKFGIGMNGPVSPFHWIHIQWVNATFPEAKNESFLAVCLRIDFELQAPQPLRAKLRIIAF